MDGWMNQAYSRLSTTHGHITDCKLLVCMYWTRLVLVRPAASLYWFGMFVPENCIWNGMQIILCSINYLSAIGFLYIGIPIWDLTLSPRLNTCVAWRTSAYKITCLQYRTHNAQMSFIRDGISISSNSVNTISFMESLLSTVCKLLQH